MRPNERGSIAINRGRGGRVGPVVAVLAIVAAAVVGAAIPMMSPFVAVGLAIGVGGLAVLALARRVLAPSRVLIPSPAQPVAVAVDAPVSWTGATAVRGHRRARGRAVNATASAFWLPRLFYYLGMLTVAQLTIRPALAFTLSDWLFLAAFLLAGWELIVRRQPLPFNVTPALLVGCGLFAAGGIASSLGAELPGQSLAIVVRFLYLIVIWFGLGPILLQRRAHVVTAVRLWGVSAAITGLGAIGQALFGNIIPNTTAEWGRMTGFTFHTTDLGGVTSIALIPALAIAVQERGRPGMKLLDYMAPPLIVAGLLLSVSVAAMAAALAGVVLWLAINQFRPRTLLALAAVGLIAVTLVSSGIGGGVKSPQSRLAMVTDANAGEEATLLTRVDTFRAAWREIGRNPLIGVGLDEVSSQTEGLGVPVEGNGQRVIPGHSVHNIVLGPWHTAGVFGMVGMLIVLGGAAMLALDTVRGARNRDEWVLAVALTSSFVAFVLHIMVNPLLYNRYGWVSVALLLVVRSGQRLGNHPAGIGQGASWRRRSTTERHSAIGSRRHRGVISRSGALIAHSATHHGGIATRRGRAAS